MPAAPPVVVMASQRVVEDVGGRQRRPAAEKARLTATLMRPRPFAQEDGPGQRGLDTDPSSEGRHMLIGLGKTVNRS